MKAFLIHLRHFGNNILITTKNGLDKKNIDQGFIICDSKDQKRPLLHETNSQYLNIKSN